MIKQYPPPSEDEELSLGEVVDIYVSQDGERKWSPMIDSIIKYERKNRDTTDSETEYKKLKTGN